MFTGIIEHLGKVEQISSLKGGIELTISAESEVISTLEVDDSISVNGVCQTVVALSEQTFKIQAVEETLRKTTFDQLSQGDIVNLEQSLTLQTKIDGHIVQGHVDTVGTVDAVEEEGANWLFTISFPEDWAHLIVGRGSIAIDGISLTVARLEETSFTVAIIPYTYEHTTLKDRDPGSKLNLEFDILGKYVARMLGLAKKETADAEDISMETLGRHGFLGHDI